MNENPTVDVHKIQPITKFIYTLGVLPTSYLMSMTYEEQLVWLCNYISQTLIPAINDDVAAVQELQQLYIDLQNYVNNYFDNLDVQEEINNKLEQMAQSGELTNLIETYIDPYIEAQNENINEFKNTINTNLTSYENNVNAQLNLMNTKVDNATSGSPLVASDVSEMTNTDRIYVNTTDGKWYYYDGDSWEIGGTYQSSAIADESITLDKLADDTKFNLNSRINNVNELIDNNEQVLDLSGNLINSTITNGIPNYDDVSTRVLTENMIYIPKDTNFIVTKNTDNYSIDVYRYNKDMEYLNTLGIERLTTNWFLTCNNKASYIRLRFSKADSTSDITPEEVLANISIKLEKINKPSPYIVGTNLFNSAKYTQGYIENNKYTITPYATYKTSEIIKLKPLTTYSISSFRKFALYDENLEYIEDSFIDANTSNYTFTTTGVAYVCFSYSNSAANTLILNEGDSVATYEPYRLYLPSVVYNSEMNRNNVLYGKKLATCGDSFTQYTNATFPDGQYSGENKVWPYLIGLRNNMTIQQLAVSGSTMTNVSGTQTKFSESLYQTIDSDADYIIIKYGINDEHLSAPIGTINDNTNTTFYGAWNVVMSYIIEHHPTAKIGIIVTNGLTMDTSKTNNSDYANAIIEIAKKYGIPTLNEWNDPNVPLLLRTGRNDVSESIRDLRRNTFRVSADNTHENYICHEYESTFIEDFLRRL